MYENAGTRQPEPLHAGYVEDEQCLSGVPYRSIDQGEKKCANVRNTNGLRDEDASAASVSDGGHVRIRSPHVSGDTLLPRARTPYTCNPTQRKCALKPLLTRH